MTFYGSTWMLKITSTHEAQTKRIANVFEKKNLEMGRTPSPSLKDQEYISIYKKKIFQELNYWTQAVSCINVESILCVF